jgi:DNA repair exonuclease SbcCD ATPase subunit
MMGALRRDYAGAHDAAERVVNLKSTSERHDALRSILAPSRNQETNDISAVASLLAKASGEIDEVHRRNKEIEAAASKVVAQFKRDAAEAKDRADKLQDEIERLRAENDEILSSAENQIANLKAELRRQSHDVKAMSQERDQAMDRLEEFRSRVASLINEAPRDAPPAARKFSFAARDPRS